MSENRTKVRLLQKQVWRKGLVSIRVTKPEGFTFTPGQFVRLGLDIEADGKTEYAARGYSLASVPSDPFLEFFIVEVPNGLVSPRLCTLEAGSELWLENDLWGSLLSDRLPASQNLWCLSTGTGLAPFLSILRQESAWEKWPTIVLVHSVRLAEDLAYTQLIQKIKDDSSLGGASGRNLVYIPVVTREATQFLSRRIPDLIRSGNLAETAGVKFDSSVSSVLLCGNPARIKEVRALLKPLGFQASRRGEPGNLIAENLWQK